MQVVPLRLQIPLESETLFAVFHSMVLQGDIPHAEALCRARGAGRLVAGS